MLAACALLLAVLVAGAGPVAAHQLQVTRATLTEGPDSRYLLLVELAGAPAERHPAPELPEFCALQDQPTGAGDAAALLYQFRCDRPLAAGDRIMLPWQREGVMLTVRWQRGDAVSQFFAREAGGIQVPLAELRAASGSTLAALYRYLVLGVEHILIGVDHLLFVAGLMLLVDGRWMLIKTITAFTLAHSITLAGATLDLVNLPPRGVEAAIALSIMFLAAEIVRKSRGATDTAMEKPWLVAFLFGLLHGFGFAGALGELGLPPGEVPIALLAFNLGVELGQLLFVMGLLGLFWAAGRLYQRWPVWLRPAAAYGLGTVAAFWFLERGAAIFLAA